MPEFQMAPINLNREIYARRQAKTDPAFREISNGVVDRIGEMLRDPSLTGISCCIEGCCVSWCCIQIS
ncbi:MAG: hypothetical protein QNJ12_05960 [Ilumatobacter sp.]|uniref:hypothetical protein n=1 Tax=Ilumatobacter sp. TaxID=1967498 RepID=UPI00261EBD3E|nr:hypothetical protein [Ilumatobacter sp.]MDJ0768316.1 hypothetical protein [Ilumatobacter sp.]